ncbi:hypothetical protein FRC02_001651 [Tulasnella sp. 418]|nr:hypothetical protein FRC02_001651 [Tulasnella sp. 418]
MLRERSEFVKARDLSFTGETFNLFLAFKLGPLQCQLPGRAPKLHKCITARVEYMFTNDTLEQQWDLEQDGAGFHLTSQDLSSDKEDLGEDSSSEDENAGTATQTVQNPLFQGDTSLNTSISSLLSSNVSRNAPAPSASTPTTSHPDPIRLEPRVFEFGSYIEPYVTGLTTLSIDDWCETTREAANGTPPRTEVIRSGVEPLDLRIQGRNVAEIAEKLLQNARLAVLNNDGTQVIPLSYHISIIGRSVDQEPHTVSWGKGINIEACTRLFDIYTESFSQYFIKKAGEFLSLAPGPSAIHSSLASQERLNNMEVLGACVLYFLVATGRLPAGISPFLMQLVVNDFNIHSISKSLVCALAPDVYEMVMEWRALGPAGNVNTEGWRSVFLNLFQDIHPSTLQNRSAAVHDGLESHILQHLLVGPITQEMRAFAKGVMLPFRSGYNISNVICSYDGGSAGFFKVVAGGFIKSFDDIKSLLRFNSVPGPRMHSTLAEANTRLQALTSNDRHFHDYIVRFLQGTGKVHEGNFDDAQSRGIWKPISPADLEDPGFRSRIFYRACTGSNLILHEGDITVAFNATPLPDPEDSDYHKAGYLQWKTCPRKVVIPGMWLLQYLDIPDGQVTEENGSPDMSPDMAIDFCPLLCLVAPAFEFLFDELCSNRVVHTINTFNSIHLGPLHGIGEDDESESGEWTESSKERKCSVLKASPSANFDPPLILPYELAETLVVRRVPSGSITKAQCLDLTLESAVYSWPWLKAGTVKSTAIRSIVKPWQLLNVVA